MSGVFQESCAGALPVGAAAVVGAAFSCTFVHVARPPGIPGEVTGTWHRQHGRLGWAQVY